MKNQHTVLSAMLLAAFAAAPVLYTHPASAAQAASEAEAKASYYKHLVDFEFVKQQVEIPPRKGVMLIDSRPTARKYDMGHIPGSVNIPDTHFDKHLDKLPADKSTLLLFYCEGPSCTLSHQSAAKAEALGYANIRVYTNGYPEWVAKGMTGSVAGPYVKKLIDEKAGVVLVDSRPRRVFEKGAIPTAVNIPDTEFDKHLDKLPADKAALVIFYCGGLECVLSENSAAKAMKLGYTKVMTYAEGYPGWTKLYGAAPAADAPAAAQPATAAKGPVAIEPGKEKGSIAVASFERIMKESPDALLLVDVRDPKEFAKGSIKGAVNIPIGELEKKIDGLPAAKPIVFLCGTGARAGEAYDMVKLLKGDLKAYFLDAEIKFLGDGNYSIKAPK